MNLTRINTNLLVSLDLLLTEESVSRAAERHGVTASAMSHSLRNLRDLFDDPLLTRSGSAMVPTPFADELRGPLHRALRELELTVSGSFDFDPARSERSFIVLAPDFVSTFLLPHLGKILVRDAPNVDVEIRPVDRYGNALRLNQTAQLAEGDVDFVIAAVLDDVVGIRAHTLYEERFVCIVREDHPLVEDELDLETYAAIPHALTTITDERTPSWIDEALAEHDLTRRIAVRTRYFMAVPLLVADSDLLATCPYQLARYFAERLPLRILEPPLELPSYHEFLGWHRRYDSDPGSRWLRNAIREAADRAVASAAPDR